MRPEILAPAGDRRSLRAALSAGADAVYFGLDEGLNARARAANFSVGRLAETVDDIHRAGARAYVTLNTLVFEDELPVLEGLIRATAEAGVDALIVQDPAVALLARDAAPTLEIHASTQMTISSPQGAKFAAELGVKRIVVPRELSVEEIRQFADGSSIPLEVFVHGALCMSWSGQCLTSEAWGGRSANRGQCAQSCRLPYDLVVDGVTRATEGVRYFLSPLDLAALDQVPMLADLGVASLKIEGRLKGPAYVANAVHAYRRRLQGAKVDLQTLALAYSRGFSSGFLAGTDHQALVEGRFPKHRGALVGEVAQIGDRAVRVVRATRAYAKPVAVEPIAGMGVGFDTGAPELEEPGGPLFSVRATKDGWWFGFGQPGPDLTRVDVGDYVWLSGDPRLDAQAESLPPPTGRLPVTVEASGEAGQPLTAVFRCRDVEVQGTTDAALTPADRGGLDDRLLQSKLGAFGGTPFRLATIINRVPPGLFVPPSGLKALRRKLATSLEAQYLSSFRRRLPPSARRPVSVGAPTRQERRAVEVVPLCRTDAQLDAVIALGGPYVELDWMERVGLGRAVDRARAAGLEVGIATPRVQKPGEAGIDAHTERLAPDTVLVRHWGGLEHFRRLPADRRPVVHGDFSLNVTNSITARHLLALGVETLTASHDLDERQLIALLKRVPAERMTVTAHHHIPTFHTEHCVYAHQLSDGRDYRTCGRPCENHRIALRDPAGFEHPVVVDVECRNTVFDARAQSAARVVRRLIAEGVRRLRVEFVWETAAQTKTVLQAWRDFAEDRIGPADLTSRVAAHEQFGVTAGTMRVLQSP